MKAESVVLAWVVILFVCVLGLLGKLLTWPASLASDWHPADWAAWVQAVGSIVAIAAAVVVAGRQERQAEKLRAEERREAETRALAFAQQAIDEVHRATLLAYSTIWDGKSIGFGEVSRDLVASCGLLNDSLRMQIPETAIALIYNAKKVGERMQSFLADTLDMDAYDAARNTALSDLHSLRTAGDNVAQLICARKALG